MTDLSQLTDAQLAALYHQGQQPDIGGMVTAEAQRQGVDPALALRVAQQESGLRPNAVSPKGAIGPMQLMPATAQGLGVDPHDPAQNIRGGVTYLKQQVDHFGDPRLAAAAYNAGPGAVERAGGVPNYPETQNYVRAVAPAAGDLSKLSDDQLRALYAQSGAPQGALAHGQSANGGVEAWVGGDPGDGSAIPPAPQAPPPQPPGAGDEAWSAFWAPFQHLGGEARDYLARHSNPNAARLGDIGDLPHLAGAALNTLNAPIDAIVQPTASALSHLLPAPQQTHVEWRGGIPHQYIDGPMSQGQAKDAFAGDINMALSGARAPAMDLAALNAASLAHTPVPGRNLTEQVRAVAPQMPVNVPRTQPTMAGTVADLEAQKRRLYGQVDASGFTFPGADIANLADHLESQLIARGGPAAAQASPQAHSIVGRLRALATQPAGVPLSHLDKVRSDIWPLLMEQGGADAMYGGILRSGIDQHIGAANAPYIAEARDANTRWSKADEVVRRVRSAELAAGRANSGENLGNAIRQKLSPMIDPMHSHQVANLTPEESAAIERVVVGDPLQNTLRTWGNRLRNPMWTGAATTPAALIGFGGGGPMGGATAAGLTAAGMQAAGQALRGAAERRTMTNVERLVQAIAGTPPVKSSAAAEARRQMLAAAIAGRPPLDLQADPSGRGTQN